MDEKDSLGEKMRLKERAEEDRYFAERDRELIAQLKHVQEAEHEKMVRELARGRCPQCGERLRRRPIHGSGASWKDSAVWWNPQEDKLQALLPTSVNPEEKT